MARPSAVGAAVGLAAAAAAALLLASRRRAEQLAAQLAIDEAAEANAKELKALVAAAAAKPTTPTTTTPATAATAATAAARPAPAPAAAPSGNGADEFLFTNAERKRKAAEHVKFGNFCARSGKPEKALEHFASALRYRPSSAAAHHNSGGVCQRLRRFEQAIHHYEAALAIKPGLIEAASNLAVAQLNAGRVSDAVGSCRRAIKLQADAGDGLNSEAFHHLNVGLRLLGRRNEAVQETWAAIAAEAERQGEGRQNGGGTHASGTAVVKPTRLALPAGPPPPAQAACSLTVVCVKWGAKYDAAYVNKLANMARRSLGVGGVASFICFTEDGKGLDGGIEVRPLPSKEGWEGWWYKAHLFSSAAQLTGRILYLDLDTVLVGSLEPLRCYTGPLATLSTQGFDAEEGNADGYNTSVLLWDADWAGGGGGSGGGGGGSGGGGGGLRALHDALRPEVFRCLMRWDHWVEMVAPNAHLLQSLHPGMFVDYRATHKAGKGKAGSGPPEGAACVCFPRYPKPHEAEAGWIGEYWR